MKSKKWSEKKSMRNGAVFGVLYSIYLELENGLTLFQATTPYFIGLWIGGAIGGAFLFVLVTWVRNFFIKS